MNNINLGFKLHKSSRQECHKIIHPALYSIGLMQKSPPIFKKMLLNDVALLWMRGFHAYGIVSVS